MNVATTVPAQRAADSPSIDAALRESLAREFHVSAWQVEAVYREERAGSPPVPASPRFSAYLRRVAYGRDSGVEPRHRERDSRLHAGRAQTELELRSPPGHLPAGHMSWRRQPIPALAARRPEAPQKGWLGRAPGARGCRDVLAARPVGGPGHRDAYRTATERRRLADDSACGQVLPSAASNDKT
jgi:hypothetical protein